MISQDRADYVGGGGMVKSTKAVALDYRLRPALRGHGGEPAGGRSLSRSAVPMIHNSSALRDDPARPFQPAAISRVRGEH
jgi:hypothetical protein